MSAPDTLRFVIPLQVRRRNGRPKILPPADIEATSEPPIADPRLLRAVARAWDWRRRLDRGEAATLQDIAATEGVTPAFISRFIRLAYLSPAVLDQLLLHHRPCAVSRDTLTETALRPWVEQTAVVFDE